MYAGYYFTGDGCRRDADGYYWITGTLHSFVSYSSLRGHWDIIVIVS
jgi:acetyl-CoA synthetase